MAVDFNLSAEIQVQRITLDPALLNEQIAKIQKKATKLELTPKITQRAINEAAKGKVLKIDIAIGNAPALTKAFRKIFDIKNINGLSTAVQELVEKTKKTKVKVDTKSAEADLEKLLNLVFRLQAANTKGARSGGFFDVVGKTLTDSLKSRNPQDFIDQFKGISGKGFANAEKALKGLANQLLELDNQRAKLARQGLLSPTIAAEIESTKRQLIAFFNTIDASSPSLTKDFNRITDPLKEAFTNAANDAKQYASALDEVNKQTDILQAAGLQNSELFRNLKRRRAELGQGQLNQVPFDNVSTSTGNTGARPTDIQNAVKKLQGELVALDNIREEFSRKGLLNPRIDAEIDSTRNRLVALFNSINIDDLSTLGKQASAIMSPLRQSLQSAGREAEKFATALTSLEIELQQLDAKGLSGSSLADNLRQQSGLLRQASASGSTFNDALTTGGLPQLKGQAEDLRKLDSQLQGLQIRAEKFAAIQVNNPINQTLAAQLLGTPDQIQNILTNLERALDLGRQGQGPASTRSGAAATIDNAQREIKTVEDRAKKVEEIRQRLSSQSERFRSLGFNRAADQMDLLSAAIVRLGQSGASLDNLDRAARNAIFETDAIANSEKTLERFIGTIDRLRASLGQGLSGDLANADAAAQRLAATVEASQLNPNVSEAQTRRTLTSGLLEIRQLDQLNSKTDSYSGKLLNLAASQKSAFASQIYERAATAFDDSARRIIASADSTQSKVRRLQIEFTRLKTVASIEAQGGFLGSLGNLTGLAVKRLSSFLLVARGAFAIQSAFTESFNTAVRLETQFVKLSQVFAKTSFTETEVTKRTNKLSSAVFDLGKSYGVAVSEIAQASRILAQAGFAGDALTQTLSSITKAQLGPTFNDINQTAEASIAILNQFDLSASELNRTLGGISRVSALYAVEAEGIAKAVRKAGGAFKSARGKIDEFVAAFTILKSETREADEALATGLRNISIRLQRASIQQKVGGLLGINFLDQKGQFIGVIDAIDRIQSKLKELGIASTDPRFAEVAERIAGARQFARLLPLIDEFKQLQQIQQQFANGAGTLDEDAERALDTIANSIERAKNEFTELSSTIINSRLFKFFVDSVNFMVSAVNSLIQVLDNLSGAVKFIAGAGLAAALGRSKFTSFLFNSVGVPGFSTGGDVPGRGPNRDSVLAYLTPGEFVLQRNAVDAIGVDKLRYINDNASRFNKGGSVGGTRFAGGFAGGGLIGGGKEIISSITDFFGKNGPVAKTFKSAFGFLNQEIKIPERAAKRSLEAPLTIKKERRLPANPYSDYYPNVEKYKKFSPQDINSLSGPSNMSLDDESFAVLNKFRTQQSNRQLNQARTGVAKIPGVTAPAAVSGGFKTLGKEIQKIVPGFTKLNVVLGALTLGMGVLVTSQDDATISLQQLASAALSGVLTFTTLKAGGKSVKQFFAGFRATKPGVRSSGDLSEKLGFAGKLGGRLRETSIGGNTLAPLAKRFGPALKVVGRLASGIGIAVTAFATLKSVIGSVTESMRQNAEAALKSATTEKEVLEQLSKINSLDNVDKSFDIFGAVGNLIDNSGINSFFSELSNRAIEMGGSFLNSIGGFFTGLNDSIKSATGGRIDVAGTFDAIAGWFRNAEEDAKRQAENLGREARELLRIDVQDLKVETNRGNDTGAKEQFNDAFERINTALTEGSKASGKSKSKVIGNSPELKASIEELTKFVDEAVESGQIKDFDKLAGDIDPQKFKEFQNTLKAAGIAFDPKAIEKARVGLEKMSVLFLRIDTVINNMNNNMNRVQSNMSRFDQDVAASLGTGFNFTIPDTDFDLINQGLNPSKETQAQIQGILKNTPKLFQEAFQLEQGARTLGRVLNEQIAIAGNKISIPVEGDQNLAVGEFLKDQVDNLNLGRGTESAFNNFVDANLAKLTEGLEVEDGSVSIPADKLTGVIDDFVAQFDGDKSTGEVLKRAVSIQNDFNNKYSSLLAERINAESKFIDRFNGLIDINKTRTEFRNRVTRQDGTSDLSVKQARAIDIERRSNALRGTGISGSSSVQTLLNEFKASKGRQKQAIDNKDALTTQREVQTQSQLSKALEQIAGGTDSLSSSIKAFDEAVEAAKKSTEFFRGALLGSDEQLINTAKGIQAFTKIANAKSPDEARSILSTFNESTRSGLQQFISANPNKQAEFDRKVGIASNVTGLAPKEQAAVQGEFAQQAEAQKALVSITQTQITAVDNLNTTLQGQEQRAITALQGGMNQINGVIQNLNASIQKIPQNIQHNHNIPPINVNINGAGALASLEQGMQNLVSSQINQAIQKSLLGLQSVNNGLNLPPVLA